MALFNEGQTKKCNVLRGNYFSLIYMTAVKYTFDKKELILYFSYFY